MLGAAVAKGGFGVILFAGWTKTIIFIVLAPLIGFALAFVFIAVSSWVLYKRKANPSPVNIWSKRLQLVSAALYSLGHGGNDAQKTMGIITSLLVSAGLLSTFNIPLWVVLAAHAAMGLGTLFGGWRIVKTMGQKIVKLRPIDGVCAETASAVSLFTATHFGIPVSTTHIITGAISGVGSSRRFSAVRWGVALKIVWAWILTIPLAAALGGLIYFIVSKM